MGLVRSIKNLSEPKQVGLIFLILYSTYALWIGYGLLLHRGQDFANQDGDALIVMAYMGLPTSLPVTKFLEACSSGSTESVFASVWVQWLSLFVGGAVNWSVLPALLYWMLMGSATEQRR